MSLATTLMAVGIPAEQANRLGYEDRVPLDGNGTTQGSATELLATQTNVAMGTSAGETAFKLPADAEYFQPYFLLNTTAETALIFPPVGDTIDANAVDASVEIETDLARVFMRVEEGRWVSMPSGEGGGGIASIVAGAGISVDNTDLDNPVVSNDGVLSVSGSTGISVDVTDPQNPVVINTGVVSVTAGSNVSITGTAQNPIINAVVPPSGVESVVAGTGIDVDATDPANPIVALEPAPDVRNYLDTGPYVANRAALAAMDTTKDTVAWLKEAGREGQFQWSGADLSALVAIDTQQGIYVPPASDTTGASGAWVRSHAGSLNPDWFGATGGSNDTTAVQACLTLAYNRGWATSLAKLYTCTSALNVRDQVIEGTDINSTGIFGNHSGRTLNMDNVTTDGFVLRNLLVQGNGTNATNGTSTGLWVSSSTEITAHALLENVRFWRHGKGTDGTGTYTLFDSTLIKVDFLECATWGQHLSGSQTTMVGCTYRVCGWGVFADAPSAASISGGTFDGCTWVQNTFDMVFGSNTVRPIRIYGGWMEQTATASFGTVAAGEVYFQSLVVDGCLFQPAATAVLDGVWSLAGGAKGILTFSSCVAFKSPYSLASIPGGSTFYSDEGDLNFRRLNCATDDGSGNVAVLLDETSFGVPVITAESVLLSDFTGSNASTAQPVFSSTQDALSLAADRTYEFDAEYFITRAAGTNSHTTGVLFGGTATFDAVGYLAQVTNPTGNTLANVQQIWSAAATEVVLTAANTSATENLLIKLKGRVRTNAAGTLIPQFKYSAAPGGAPTVKANSAFRIWSIGSDQAAVIGPWA